jgi:hypothetical protein
MNVQWVQTAIDVNTHASIRPDLTGVNATVDFYWEMTSTRALLV